MLPELNLFLSSAFFPASSHATRGPLPDLSSAAFISLRPHRHVAMRLTLSIPSADDVAVGVVNVLDHLGIQQASVCLERARQVLF